MKHDIERWVRECDQCQRFKTVRHVKPPQGDIGLPERRGQHVHLDIVGPFPTCGKYQFVFTMIDRFSRWPEAVPLTNITAATIAKKFVETWVSRYGAPARITTDR